MATTTAAPLDAKAEAKRLVAGDVFGDRIVQERDRVAAGELERRSRGGLAIDAAEKSGLPRICGDEDLAGRGVVGVVGDLAAHLFQAPLGRAGRGQRGAPRRLHLHPQQPRQPVCGVGRGRHRAEGRRPLRGARRLHDRREHVLAGVCALVDDKLGEELRHRRGRGVCA